MKILTLKNSIFLFVSILFVSCSPSSNAIKNKECTENIVFKKAFFDNVHNVENQVYRNKDETYYPSLVFIAKYSEVTFESMLFDKDKAPEGSFIRDKVKWLEWYEENKCKNIRLKDSIR